MSKYSQFNEKLGLRITKAVGTMTCAYMFALIALISLPTAIAAGSVIILVAWIAQTFLQLVLLSVIMYGQSLQGEATERVIQETHDAVVEELTDVRELIQDLHEKHDALHDKISQVHIAVVEDGINHGGAGPR